MKANSINLLKLLLVLVSLVVLSTFLAFGIEGLSEPLEDEAPLLWVSSIQQGVLYPEGDLFVEGISNVYAPVYYLIWGGIARVVGVNAETGIGLSLLSTLLVGFMLYLVCWRLTKNRWISLVPCMLFLLSPNVKWWSVAPRPDILGLLFSIAGVYLVFRYRSLYAVPLFLLAVFTKQNFIAAPVAVGLYLLFGSKNWREAVRFSTAYIGGFLLLLLIGQGITGGTFIRHFVLFPILSGGEGIISPTRLVWITIVTVAYNPATITLGLVVVVLHFLRKRAGLLEVWFLVSLVVMLATIGKPGSSYNYGLELIAVGGLLVTTWLTSRFPLVRKLEAG